MATCNLSVFVSVTGDCSNLGLGSYTITIYGSNPPYYYQMLSPVAEPNPTQLPLGVTSFTETNLTSGAYTYLIFDSCDGTPTQRYINALISDGVCISLDGHSDTTCNLSNGSITATTNNELAVSTFSLYENTLGFISSSASNNDTFVFTNLNPGTYYVTVDDSGGCTAKSETCIVKESTPLDFGFYVVNDTGCEPTPAGKIFVTGITGYGPYIYQWSTGALTSSITGLTAGAYQLTLTDSTGCQTTKSVVVNLAPQIGVVNYSQVSPSCNSNDGEITIIISGGTAPYNYVASNGQSLITFDQTFNMTGLTSGNYSISVTDAGLCTKVFTYQLFAPNGFSILSVGIVNSTCNNTTGALSPITLVGGTPPFTYTLQYPSGNSVQQTINGFTNQFQGLSAGTYTLTISNISCSFTNTYTINNVEKFTLNTNVTGTTCNTNNGSVEIILSTGGTSPYTYYFEGQSTISNTSQTAVTYNNLFSGTYLISVSDATNCTQTQTIVVPDTPSIDFTLVSTNASNINNGQIQVYITEGVPPYSLTWSDNVNGQTGLTLTNLSAGTYSLNVIDGNGCELSREVTLYGYNTYGTYGVYTYCESSIDYNGIVVQKKIPQMYIEGYYDLVSGETNCILNQAIFYSQVSLAGVSTETPFYTSESLGDYPTDGQWYDAIRNALLSYPVIGNVVILPAENRITIETNCSDQSLSLDNTEISVSLKISYDISCVCNIPPVPGPIFNDCDMIYIQPPSEVVYYQFSSDTSITLTVPDYTFDSYSVAFTNNKLWLYNVGVGTTTIKEWNITTNPFTAVYNRDINLNFEIGEALGALSDTELITTNSSVSPNIFVKINVSTNTPVITNLFPLDTNKYVVGTIEPFFGGINIVSLQIDLTSAPFVSYYLVVHNSLTLEPYYEIDVTSIAGRPTGLIVDNNILYILDETSSIYEVGLTSPYPVTYVSNVSAGGSMQSITQRASCLNVLPSEYRLFCGGSLSIIGGFPSFVNGYHRIRFEVGTGIGNAVFTFTSLLKGRAQIIWNDVIVADSLFLLNSSGPTYDSFLNQITAITEMQSYFYSPPIGNSVNVFPTTDWINNGVIPVNFTSADFAPCCDIRGAGSVGNQIGVVPAYPTFVALSSYPDIQLQFTKTSQYPNYVDVIIYGIESYGPNIELTQCP